MNNKEPYCAKTYPVKVQLHGNSFSNFNIIKFYQIFETTFNMQMTHLIEIMQTYKMGET